jgi:hypothetical protein
VGLSTCRLPDGSFNTTHEYTSTAELYGDLVSGYDGTNKTYYQYDALGSTDALLDDNQTAMPSIELHFAA